LLHAGIVPAEDWEVLAAATRDELARMQVPQLLLVRLVEFGLLTEYQSMRIQAGKRFGLILGHYRVLGRLGAGGMGVVYKAEHVLLRRPVAIKVLTLPPGESSPAIARFYAEVRAVAKLRHPNIIGAIDAGHVLPPRAAPAGPGTGFPLGGDGRAWAYAPEQPLYYFVQEYVPGEDLEAYVKRCGRLEAAEVCGLVAQVAAALDEAHKHHLVHRDIKPSNILRTPEGQAKLLDFGLARHLNRALTEPGTAMGSIDYIAPEQARDASTVDIRADLYSLGGTLFWCLTGQPPFPPREDFAEDLRHRSTAAPPSARAVAPAVPAGLEAVVARMMAPRPDDRYPTPQAVAEALAPFLPAKRLHTPSYDGRRAEDSPGTQQSALSTQHASTPRVLIVDDEPDVRTGCRLALERDGLRCHEAGDGAEALADLGGQAFDLVLLDMTMPGVGGLEVCRRLRQQPPCAHLKVIVYSGKLAAEELARVMAAGADDYLTKPFNPAELRARVQSALRLKEAQDQADRLYRHVLSVNRQLEQSLSHRDGDLLHARNALVLALAKLAEYRNSESGPHLRRMGRYCRVLAEAAAGEPAFAGLLDANFIDMLELCVPLHDIGLVGIPDHILLKPGKLDDDERVLMQTHTLIGAETLHEVAQRHGSSLAFLAMAIDIARYHHERYDGTGYPDRLAGSRIPLAARIVAVVDVYDGLRCRRVYKPALTHDAAVELMLVASPGQLDPALLQIFQSCHRHFERIYRELAD
jgi:response regulator RpfG family c-di-GMP phosphodiesterase/serine/threonine protein kinase